MNINKDELRALSNLPDAQLWESIGKIAKDHGYSLAEITPSPKDLEKIRSVLRGGESISMRDAARLLNSYKRKK